MNNKFMDSNKTRLTCVQSSPGKNFNWVFLPGGPGINSGYYQELISLLTIPGNIWLIDLPENGSNKMSDAYQAEYDFDLWELCLKEVINSLDKVILVGHSFSGIYPLLFPEIINPLLGLVIICSASRPWRENAINKGLEKKLPSFKKELAEFLSNKTRDNFEKFLKIYIHYYFSPKTLSRDSQVFLREAFNFHAQAWWFTKALTINFDEIVVPKMPTLIIGGSEDCTVPFDGYLSDNRFQKPNIQIKEIQGAFHFPWLNKPAEVKRLIEEYADKLGAVNE